ncbi:MAG TPA: GGDEF domain-containing protein, partial [Pilimelia sp.]|nr:GGDEF domain-containing protein [Pilimelia sp.]
GELGARRAAVLAYTSEAGDAGAARLLAAVADGGAPVIHRMTAAPHPRSAVSAAWAADGTVLRAHLDARVDPWLAERMPQARALIVVPFQLAEVRGALVMQMAQGTGWAPRVERRIVNTAEQATSQAGGALERAVLTERLRALSHYDGLTRVANRRHFDEFLARELGNAGTTGTQVGLLLVDIDHFKRLNDTYGHQVGDEVLQQVAQAIRGRCPDPHLVARYGGEEFAVVLLDTDPASALAAGEDVRRAVAEAAAALNVTASIGVACYPGHGLAPAELVAVADAALYRAKAGGRDQVQPGEVAPPRKFARMADGAPQAPAGNGSASPAAAR